MNCETENEAMKDHISDLMRHIEELEKEIKQLKEDNHKQHDQNLEQVGEITNLEKKLEKYQEKYGLL